MPAHDLAEGRREGVGGQETVNLQRAGDVVGGLARMELFYEPQPLLREGKGKPGLTGLTPLDRDPGAGVVALQLPQQYFTSLRCEPCDPV
ncbi:MAG TPA: hypothetical protein VJX67_08740, partial [Blastocatellia bacterium]|nr:hypothetical protein [Blastocatellia bacterium]